MYIQPQSFFFICAFDIEVGGNHSYIGEPVTFFLVGTLLHKFHANVKTMFQSFIMQLNASRNNRS